MGILIAVLLGLVAIALFCIFMDLITFLYSIAWILPILILVIFIIRLIFRPDFRVKVGSVILGQRRCKGSTLPPTVVTGDESLKHIDSLIDAALVDGVISEREKRAIITKGVGMGIAPEEVEAHIESRLSEL